MIELIASSYDLSFMHHRVLEILAKEHLMLLYLSSSPIT